MFICEIAQTLVGQQEAAGARKSQREKQTAMVSSVGRILDAVTLRHRLIESAWESEILSKVRALKTVNLNW